METELSCLRNQLETKQMLAAICPNEQLQLTLAAAILKLTLAAAILKLEKQADDQAVAVEQARQAYYATLTMIAPPPSPPRANPTPATPPGLPAPVQNVQPVEDLQMEDEVRVGNMVTPDQPDAQKVCFHASLPSEDTLTARCCSNDPMKRLPKTQPSMPRFSPFLSFLYLACIFFPFMNSVNASASPFSTITINLNGIGNAAKVVCETKSSHTLQSQVCIKGYKVFESTGRKVNRKQVKWGVAIGVNTSLQGTMVPVHDSLAGRVVAVDVIIPTDNGRGFRHRLIGLYAPYDPGIADALQTLRSFWGSVREICTTASHSWSIIGDFNATLSNMEWGDHLAHDGLSRRAYREFLNASMGRNVWSLQGNNNAREDGHTYQAFSLERCCSIIDRCVSSQTGVLMRSISILKTFIPGTDHRLILANLILQPPRGMGHHAYLPDQQPASYNARFLFPKKGDHSRFHTFAEHAERMVDDEGVVSTTLTTDDEYGTLYNFLTTVLDKSASTAFNLPRQYAERQTSSPHMKILLREFRRLNKLISAIKRETIHHLLTKAPWASFYLKSSVTAMGLAPETLPVLLQPQHSVGLLLYLRM
ncbi:hypothetical protein PQX77_007441 [Marasmius sp. AFHP31]|nr:hypothetical protein PQX77_007441 [Marasmius sp. AFHP31]